MTIDSGTGILDKTIPFDTYAQIIDGNAEIIIAGEAFFLETGQSIVIPAYAPNSTRPNGKFKMILTVIKNGTIYPGEYDTSKGYVDSAFAASMVLTDDQKENFTVTISSFYT